MMATYVIPAVYDTVKKQIRPIGASEKLLPEYFGMRMTSLLSSNPGQALHLDASGLLYCTVVSQDSRNLIVYGSDHGAYVDTSQILSNAATNLLTTSPTDLRVTLTKKTLLDAGFADASSIYSAVQQHVVTIHEAKEAAAASAAAAKTQAQTVSRLITEAESVVREEAANIAAESITEQVVQRAAEAASELVDTRQDREISALTTRVATAENTHTADVSRLTTSISEVSDDLQELNANWTQNFTQVSRTNVEQSELISQLFEKDNAHDERLNFLKCSVDALDARVYQNFVCLVYRISDTENKLNTRIDNEVNTLNTRITREVTKLENLVDREVNTLNNRIDHEVDTLNNRITTEVTRLDDEIMRINATQAAAWTKISRTEAEIAERLMHDEFQHREDVETLNTRIDNEVDTLNTRITYEVNTLNTRITYEVDTLNNRITREVTRLDDLIVTTNAVVTEGFTKVSRTEAEIAERLMHDEFQHREDVETLNTHIDDEVNTLNNRITTEVTRLDDFIVTTNATVASIATTIAETDIEQATQIAELRSATDYIDRRLSESVINQKRSDIEQATQIAELRSATDYIDRRLSENIVMQNKRYVEQSVIQAELAQHQLNDAVRFSDLSYASVVHTRELLSLNEGFASVCASIIKNARTLIEQLVLFFALTRNGGSGSGAILDGGIDAGILG